MIPLPARWTIAVGHVLGTAVAGIGFHALAWYMNGGMPSGWFGTPTPMALSTGVAFALTGASLFALASAIDWHIKVCHQRTAERS